MISRFLTLPLVLSLFLAVLEIGCSNKGNNPFGPGTTDSYGIFTQQQGSITLKKYSGGRDSTPAVSDSALLALVQGNTTFAIDLYNKLVTGTVNTFFSPYSMSTALAMTWGGAEGQTAQDMATVLHFPGPLAALHQEWDALDLALTAHAATAGFELHIVNQVWGEKTMAFLPDYIKLLTINYGAPLLLLDFINSPDPSRQEINAWVGAQTQQQIQNLIPQGGIDTTTRLVLTNAIYFKAQWADTFQAENTDSRIFYRSDADSIAVNFMNRVGSYAYYADSEFSAVKLPYKGNATSMLIILPAKDQMAQVASGISTAFLGAVRSSLQSTDLSISLPKFSFSTGSIAMSAPLISLGMASAFSGTADFSGIDGLHDLRIKEVYHKAYVAVNEYGTTAAAATAVVVKAGAVAPSPISFFADRPFIFLICDEPTGAVLFMGELVDPSQD
jgi:serpin B